MALLDGMIGLPNQPMLGLPKPGKTPTTPPPPTSANVGSVFNQIKKAGKNPPKGVNPSSFPTYNQGGGYNPPKPKAPPPTPIINTPMTGFWNDANPGAYNPYTNKYNPLPTSGQTYFPTATAGMKGSQVFQKKGSSNVPIMDGNPNADVTYRAQSQYQSEMDKIFEGIYPNQAAKWKTWQVDTGYKGQDVPLLDGMWNPQEASDLAVASEWANFLKKPWPQNTSQTPAGYTDLPPAQPAPSYGYGYKPYRYRSGGGGGSYTPKSFVNLLSALWRIPGR